MPMSRLLGARARNVAIVQQEPAGIGPDKPGQSHEQRGLAGSGWPEQREEFASLNVERDIVQRDVRPIGLAHAVDGDPETFHHVLQPWS